MIKKKGKRGNHGIELRNDREKNKVEIGQRKHQIAGNWEGCCISSLTYGTFSFPLELFQVFDLQGTRYENGLISSRDFSHNFLRSI